MPSSSSRNDMLLKFVQSAEFTARLCVAYLSLYPNHIGIHHFLCEKLGTFPYYEIEFYLPQLIHLVLNITSESVALEEFIIRQCELNTQCSLITFWYLQAYMSDLSLHPHTRAFRVCKRMFNQLQILVFMSSSVLQDQQKMLENVYPASIFAGVLMGGIVMPELTKKMAPVAIAQGRKAKHYDDDDTSSISTQESSSVTRYSLDISRPSLPKFSSSSSNVALHPRVQSLVRTQSHQSINFLSLEEQHRILRANYFQQETQFLYALQDISIRLIIVPREARLSALRAELALLNNKLPADVNIPIMRTYSNEVSHRVVRIDAKEATVLNSAERVPFLVTIEVLNADLSLQPNTRKNKAKVQKLLSQKRQVKRYFDLFDNEGSSSPEIDVGGGDSSESDDEYGDLGMSPMFNVLPQASTFPLNCIGKELWLHDSTFQKNNLTPTRVEEEERQQADIHLANEKISNVTARMRAAAVMLAQLDSTGAKRPKSETDAIRHGIIEEMRKLEEERLNESSVAYPNNIDLSLIDNAHPQLSSKTERKGDREDPSAAMFAEDWSVKKERIRRSSPYGHLPNWDLISVIVKTGADLRQETFACQLISVFQNVWAACNEKVWVRSIKILVTGDNSGLVETITNAISIHSIKKNLTRQKANEAIMRGHEPPREVASLKEYFIRQFGPEDTESYRKAQTNFIQSLVAYSVVSYVLQLKDRHNGNILIDTDGHVVHIDFGFLLTNTPGNVGFESAPFKLTLDYVEIIGDRFDEFGDLMKSAFKSMRKEANQLSLLVEVMQKHSSMPCFSGRESASTLMMNRFQPQMSDAEIDVFVDQLIQKSNNSVWTRLYDLFQNLTNGIY